MNNLIQGFLDGLRPVKRITVSQWADENRYLSQVAAAEHGRWRTSRTPYLRKIMDDLSVYSTYQKIIVMKGAQLGFTEAGNNWIGYIIDNSPAPSLMVQPTDDMVKRNSKMRIDTMIQASPTLALKVSKTKSRSGENTITQKNFPGGILLMAGANSPAGLRSIPIKNLFLDEVDAYPYDLGDEGSPIELAIARTRTFAKRKIFIISTPTIKDCSAIEREFLQTDQNYFYVPCPHCGQMQVLEFQNLVYDKDNYQSAKIACIGCGTLIEERFKTQMMANGEWRPEHPELSNKNTIGYHVSSLYSPFGWYSWAEMAKDYEKAKEDPSKMKTFNNTVLGITNEESGESPEWKNLYNRREDYPINSVNSDVCFLTCGVDVQKDRLELEIVGWCADKSSYSIDYRVILGNTSLVSTWDELGEILNETWTRDDGIELKIIKMAVDSGYNTSEVYAFCRLHSPKAIAIKGQDNLGIIFAPPKQVDYNRRGKKIGKTKQWNIGVSILKKELYSWLALEKTDGVFPPRYCHFPQYDERYFEGITAENYVQTTHKWVKKYERNEPLDVRIYARAAASIMGLDAKKPDQLKKIGNIQAPIKVKEEKTDEIPTKKNKRSSFWG